MQYFSQCLHRNYTFDIKIILSSQFILMKKFELFVKMCYIIIGKDKVLKKRKFLIHRREVRLVNFNKNKGVSLATLEFDVKKEGKTKTVTRNIATRCKSEEDFKERLKTNDYCDGVVIVGFINTDEGIKIPLIKEFKEIVGDYIWTFPAGQVEEGEDLRLTALRELKEETGLDTDINDITVFKPTYTSVGIIDQRISLAILECHGEPTDKYLTSGEDIKIHLSQTQKKTPSNF